MTQADVTGFIGLLEQHLHWYPLMEVQDIYKLLYQGLMGSEHGVASQEEYTYFLEKEYESVQSNPAQQLFEPVRADGALYRINLRPLKSRKMHLDELVPLLIETAGVVRATKLDLRNTWELFTNLFSQMHLSTIDVANLENFTQHLEKMDYPVMHHSQLYSQAYMPAYRLIGAAFISDLGLSDNG